jgi:hypothetical protein
MSDYDVSAQLIRENRALVLDLINAYYPRSVAQDVLIAACLDLPDPVPAAYVERDLAYLAGRDFIDGEDFPATDRRAPAHKVRRWKMTARGVTFCERGKPWDHVEAL